MMEQIIYLIDKQKRLAVIIQDKLKNIDFDDLEIIEEIIDGIDYLKFLLKG